MIGIDVATSDHTIIESKPRQIFPPTSCSYGPDCTTEDECYCNQFGRPWEPKITRIV